MMVPTWRSPYLTIHILSICCRLPHHLLAASLRMCRSSPYENSWAADVAATKSYQLHINPLHGTERFYLLKNPRINLDLLFIDF
jgi:hypothetical protein